MKSDSIDQVIDYLDDIINESIEDNSRLGYFPSLYKKVTIEVKNQIAAGFFEHADFMERLDIVFANRYLHAYSLYKNFNQPTRAWQIAFGATKRWRPIVLQHLLLGMNAHIGLDLAIATAEAVPAAQIAAFETDFEKINQILSSKINKVQNELGRIWPLLKVFDLLAGDLDESLAKFGLKKARDFAWQTALELSALSQNEREDKIKELDEQIYDLGKVILTPGIVLTLTLLLVRISELRFVRRIIKILN